MKKLSLLIAFLGLFSCASVPYYQKVNENGLHRIGYTDSKLTDTMYRVKYLDTEDAYTKFLMRASQITLENNHNYFIVKDVGSLKENAKMMNLGYGHSKDFALPTYEATVVLLKEKTPDSFDANEILKNNPPRKKK